MTEFNSAAQFTQKSHDEFGYRLLGLCDDLGITEKAVNYGVDHFCIRTNSSGDTALLLTGIQARGGVTISSTMIHGREILICRMPKLIKVGPWDIFDIEAPFPKDPPHFFEHLKDHAEIFFGIPDPNLTLDDLRRLVQNTLGLSIAHLRGTPRYSESMGIVADNTYPNPTITIFSRDSHTALKFHNFPIGVVVGHDPIDTLRG